ncbi:MAG TPA: aldo/keto reductase [Nitrospira sp.]
MSSSPTSPRSNRLINETSPYLLQHAHNPVDWYPWGAEALRRSKELNQPILLSIGYSACHWCHVMERESFENDAIAALMNRYFVCIKVDREERPDLDEIYMAATVAMNRGQGGWPMTVFLTPDQEPFFAGTYFPPEDRWGRPGFGTLLQKIADVWQANPTDVVTQAKELTARLRREWQAPSPVTIHETILDDAAQDFEKDFEPRYGGFGSAPKFPPAAGLSLLLRCYRRSGDPKVLNMVTKTLDAMAAGGIYDHIGGGFSRYSTDDKWLVPHFEKMLYDNALLARAYLEAYQVTSRSSYRQIVTEVLDYILREMTDPEGGFYSATDADSEGVEGKFFVWTPAEVAAVLTEHDDAARFCACYDITEQGNWEHRNIPNRMRPLEAVAKELNLTTDELLESMGRVKPVLYAARKQRVPPGLDDKVITAWNGMMISAMAEAGRVLGSSAYTAAARRAADFLLRLHRTPEGRLLRTSRQGRAHLDAVLEDYAYLGEGLVDLYEASGEPGYLAAAGSLAERLIESFQDRDQGGFFTTALEHEALILRGREGADGATPSGNAVAAAFLARLSFHTDRPDWREVAVAAVRAYGKQMTRYPRAFAKSIAVVDFLTEGPIELALIGKSDDPTRAALLHATREQYLPNRIIASTDTTDGSSDHPLLAGKQLVKGRAALYLCRNFTCQDPLTDLIAAAEAIRAAADLANRDLHENKLQGQLLGGCATVEGTARYAVRHASQPGPFGRLEYGYGPFGNTGLTTSKLGFGCYRVDGNDPEHGEALAQALESGVNLIDTSTNYMDGESERLVGTVLRAAVKTKGIARDEVIVLSKIGYVQGQNLKQTQAREQAGRPYPDMVKYGDGIWHCIHPDFLGEQLEASLDRLGIATLDVCLLHNPEYFLTEAARQGGPNLDAQRDIFYRRIEQAFAYLESQVSAGRIRWYGLSSNTVTAAPGDPESTSLSRFLLVAEQAAAAQGQARHHFAVLQCPMNLLEQGARNCQNNGEGERETPLEVAQRERIAVLVNRPLNAMPAKGAGVMRLAEFPLEGDPVDIDAQLKIVGALEDEYRQTLAPAIPQSGQGMAPTDFFQWAGELARLRSGLQGLEHWEQIEHQMIAPHVNQVMQAVPRLLKEVSIDQWEAWRDRYVPQLLTLLRGLRREATEKSLVRVGNVTRVIDPLLPVEKRKESLSRKSLWILASTPGVTCVLNGMRTRPYVDDSLGILQWTACTDTHRIYEAISKAGLY